MKTTHHLVVCSNYNGHKNVLFIMRGDDNRLNTEERQATSWDGQPITVGGYKDLGVVKLDRRARTATLADGRRFQFFSDYSVKEIEA